MGTELNFSTSMHPQTDGQTERMNALLELYLRYYVSANQWVWTKLLDVAQFSYNLLRSESIGRSLFEVLVGQQPNTPTSIATGYTVKSSATYKFAKGWEEQQESARARLTKEAKCMKK